MALHLTCPSKSPNCMLRKTKYMALDGLSDYQEYVILQYDNSQNMACCSSPKQDTKIHFWINISYNFVVMCTKELYVYPWGWYCMVSKLKLKYLSKDDHLWRHAQLAIYWYTFLQ